MRPVRARAEGCGRARGAGPEGLHGSGCAWEPLFGGIPRHPLTGSPHHGAQPDAVHQGERGGGERRTASHNEAARLTMGAHPPPFAPEVGVETPHPYAPEMRAAERSESHRQPRVFVCAVSRSVRCQGAMHGTTSDDHLHPPRGRMLGGLHSVDENLAQSGCGDVGRFCFGSAPDLPPSRPPHPHPWGTALLSPTSKFWMFLATPAPTCGWSVFAASICTPPYSVPGHDRKPHYLQLCGTGCGVPGTASDAVAAHVPVECREPLVLLRDGGCWIPGRGGGISGGGGAPPDRDSDAGAGVGVGVGMGLGVDAERLPRAGAFRVPMDAFDVPQLSIRIPDT